MTFDAATIILIREAEKVRIKRDPKLAYFIIEVLNNNKWRKVFRTDFYEDCQRLLESRKHSGSLKLSDRSKKILHNQGRVSN